MTRRYQVLFEPAGDEALLDTARYIQEHAGDGQAREWLKKMLKAVDKLEYFPTSFGVWTYRKGKAIYSKLIQPYRVFFVVKESTGTVHIIDIVHTARETRLQEYRD